MTLNRRSFLRTIGGAAAAARITKASYASTQTANPPSRTIQTPVLSIGYDETGAAQGFPIILLHGFPDDVRAWDGVTPPLARAGYRVLAPYLRGYGPTRFRDSAAPRLAEQAAIGQDVIDFADALKLPRFAVAGYDWGGRAAAIAAALHPDRVRATVLIGGYTVQHPAAPQPPTIRAPSITLYGADDGIRRPPLESPPDERAVFERLVARRVVPGVGHFMPREEPDAVSHALLELLA